MSAPLNKEIRDILANARKRVVQFDSKLNVFVGCTDERVDKEIEKALKAGKTVVENGITQWVEILPVMDTTKSGTAAYTWKDGNTLKAELVHFIKHPNGEVIKSSRGFAWKSWKVVFGDC